MVSSAGNGRRRNGTLLAAYLAGIPENLVGRFVVLGDHDAVELNDPVQFRRHGAKEIFRIAMRADCLRDANQRFVALGQQVLGWSYGQRIDGTTLSDGHYSLLRVDAGPGSHDAETRCVV